MEENQSPIPTEISFSWIEYLVFGSMLFLSVLIGIYYGWFKKQDTVAEYMLGGRNMGILPVTVSLVASHVSGVLLLGVPAELYVYGTQFTAVLLPNILFPLIVNNIYLPVFYNLQITSIYEYLELRFSKGTRTLGSLIFAISLMIYIPVVIYVPALAFNQVSGVSVHAISFIVSLICVFYTSFGGLKAVLWTDTLQSVFTLGSITAVVILGLFRIGGFSEMLRINEEGKRLEFFNMHPSPFERNTFWTVVIGSEIMTIYNLAVHPGAVQRFMAVPTLNRAKLVMIWALAGFIVVKILVVCMGLLMYANYHDCDPVATKMVKKPGQILPYYVMSVAQDFPGLTGLFISGVLSAALSTMSASLNTVAGTLYEDFVHFVMKDENKSEAKQSFSIKIIVILLGILCASLVYVVERLGALLQMSVSLIGVVSGSLVGLFSLGIFFPRANAKGALAGAISSVLCMAVIIFGAQYYIASGLLKFQGKITSVAGCSSNFTSKLGFNASANVQTYTGVGNPTIADDSVPLIFQISYLYYCTVGTLIVFLVGLPVSYLTEQPDISTQDPKLFAPFIRRFLSQNHKIPKSISHEGYELANPCDRNNDIKDPTEIDRMIKT